MIKMQTAAEKWKCCSGSFNAGYGGCSKVRVRLQLPHLSAPKCTSTPFRTFSLAAVGPSLTQPASPSLRRSALAASSSSAAVVLCTAQPFGRCAGLQRTCGPRLSDGTRGLSWGATKPPHAHAENVCRASKRRVRASSKHYLILVPPQERAGAKKHQGDQGVRRSWCACTPTRLSST